MRAFTKHCEYLGFRLHNPRWSWCALSPDRQRVLFTVWEDEVHRGRYVLSPIAVRRPGPVGVAADLRSGGREIEELAGLAADNKSVTAFGVSCVAKDPAAVPRVRARFDSESALVLNVFREGSSVLAEIVGRISADKLAAMAKCE